MIGVTGPPGAGKSTIVDGLTKQARAQDITVGVLAVDPTSPFTGGAVLGDRIRMRDHYLDRGVFIRSIATRGVHGGLATVARSGVKLLDAVGKDLILLETVGVGQTELDVTAVADLVLVVLVPEAGDSVQAMKAGLLEIADVFVINKADRDGAGQLATTIRSAMSLGSKVEDGVPPVALTQAHIGEGLPGLYSAAIERLALMEASGTLRERRSRRARQEMTQLLTEVATRVAEQALRPGGPASDIVDAVESGELDPYSAVRQLLSRGLLPDFPETYV